MPDDLMTINPFLRIIEDHGWTWEQLAIQMKLDYAAVSRLRDGQFFAILPGKVVRGLERIGEDPAKVQAECAEYLLTIR